MPILHTVYFRLREDDDVEAKIPGCVALFNEHKGITASVVKGKFAAVCGLAAPTDAVFTHVEVLVADSHEALHAYLHGDAHLNVWIPLIKPNLEDIVVFDHDLPTPFTGVAGSQALSLLLKLRVDAEQEALASSAAMQLSLLIAGVSNVYFAPHGGGGLDKAALIDKLDWPDKSQGFTHCLTIVATGAAAIERLLRSTELKNWLTGLTPQGHAAMVSPLEPSHEVAYPIYRDLAAKHVLITGGAQGIGLAVSRAFFMQGAAVTVLDRDEGALARLRLEMASAHTYCVDVTDENAFCETLRAVRETRPTCDVLIGNAGADPRYEGLNMSLAEWEGLFRLNVSHYFLLCREMVPHMVEAGGGSIILTSSHLAWVAKPKCIAYNCTKAANIGLVRSLAEAFGDGLIRANSVAPGWTLTDRQKASVGTPADFEDCRLNSQALPLSLTPELLAQNYLYLGSSASACLQRQTLVCDMGQAKL
uniref:Stress-response A/B barrel domain-containing protein n=1 Tax=Phaeocystis antarctica TaxID=33657 RepID=A0A7S0HQC8_9EUKA|mmetsp:Transcript_31654/g.74786  ORF Transcript_31654/g.74786 Transcript_31654/m.74786 type:complete len:476 (+) Transcript_31654:85-1512(+)